MKTGRNVSLSRSFILFCVLVFIIGIPGRLCAAGKSGVTTEPLWEFGLFPGAVYMPHYRGSDEYRLWALPLPYVIYRGKFFELDQEGVRGIFYRSENLETTLSGWGNPPVADDNRARTGMSELDSVIEAGPSLKWYFTGRHPYRTIYLQFAARAAFSVGIPDNIDIRHRGFKSAMNLVYQHDAPWGNPRWHMGLNTGIEFSDKSLHEYFYEVPPKDARPGRPAFEPDAGLSVLSLSGRIIRRISERLSFAGYVRWEYVSPAAYADSPLVQDDHNFFIGCAAIWKLKESRAPAYH
ncbi:MAG: MipA/OmpV family protein [Desulfobacterales bacterium]